MKMKTEYVNMTQFLTLNSTHNLFRYISEWDPRAHAKTKGGYLEGNITVPEELLGSSVRMVIQTHPNDCSEDSGDNYHQKCVHPGLVHVVRMGRGRRENEKEPVPNHQHWSQEFVINNGEVRIVNRTSGLDERRAPPIPQEDLVTRLNGNNITLGRRNGELNLIILQPKTSARAAEGEATVRKVIEQRIGVCDQKTLDNYENKFKGKNSLNMKRVRLLINFCRESDSYQVSSLSSQTILDTGNKDIGAMDFYDATPLKSCINGGRKVIMVSEYSLSKDVEPIFQVWDENGQHRIDLENFLVQPSQVSGSVSVKKESIIFITPAQPKLYLLQGMKIKLAVRRNIDEYVSNNKFPFTYDAHMDGQCIFCNYGLDTDKAEGFAQLAPEIPRSKPGTKKRQMNDKEDRYVPETKSLKIWNHGSPGSPQGSDGSIDSGIPESPRSPEMFLSHRRPSVIIEGPAGSVSSALDHSSDTNDPYPNGLPIESITIDLNTNWNIPSRIASVLKDKYNKPSEDLLSKAVNENSIIPTTVSAMESLPRHFNTADMILFNSGSLQDQPIPPQDIQNTLDIKSSASNDPIILQNQQIETLSAFSPMFSVDVPQQNTFSIENGQGQKLSQPIDTSPQKLFLDIENIQPPIQSQLFLNTPQVSPNHVNNQSVQSQQLSPNHIHNQSQQQLDNYGQSQQISHSNPNPQPISPNLLNNSRNPLLSSSIEKQTNIRRLTFFEERQNSQYPIYMDQVHQDQGIFTDGTVRKRNTATDGEEIHEKVKEENEGDIDEEPNDNSTLARLLQYSRFFTLVFIIIFIALQFLSDIIKDKEMENDDEGDFYLSPVRIIIISLLTALVSSFIKSRIV